MEAAAELPGNEGDLTVVDLPARKEDRAPLRRPGLESVRDPSNDRRRRVPTPGAPPWRKLCAMRVQYDGGLRVPGTCWLIAPTVAITAAHVVRMSNQKPLGAELFAGGVPSSYPSARLIGDRIHPRWGGMGHLDYDLAAVHIDPPLGDMVGRFGVVRPMDDGHLRNLPVAVAGFPNAPDMGAGNVMWVHGNTLSTVTPTRLLYDIDTSWGQSGAPLLFKRDDASPELVVGIHTHGYDATGQRLNMAQRITQEIFDTLVAWANKEAPDAT